MQTTKQQDKLGQPFPITSICREDLIGQTIHGKEFTEKDVIKIDDNDMEQIAEDMADAYTGNDTFWINLQIIAENILKK